MTKKVEVSLLESLVNQPKTKRGQATLDRLCEASEQLFFKNGYYGTSINEITRLANVAPGTFYIYFTDKLSLYCYLLMQYSHQIRKHIALEIKGCTTRKEAERIGLRAYLDFIHEHKHMYNIIWESLYIDKKLFVDYYAKFAENYIHQIKNAQLSGEMKNYDPEVVAYMMMGISNFIGLNYVMFSEHDNYTQVVDQVIEILDKGLF